MWCVYVFNVCGVGMGVIVCACVSVDREEADCAHVCGGREWECAVEQK